MDEADNVRPAICTLSLGRAVSHAIEPKLRAASAAGFQGIELFYEDIKLPARAACAADPSLSFASALLAEAHRVHRLCRKYDLIVIALQPFKNFEGLLDQQRRAQKFAKLRLWIQLAHALRTSTILIPSMFFNHTDRSTPDMLAIVRDIREAASLCAAAEPPIRIAYENMAWGAHVSSWQDMWRVVAAVDMPNVGLCLDTFQILARCWADPTRADGLRRGITAASARRELDAMISTVPVEKVFIVQLSDAKRICRDPAAVPSNGTEVKADAGPLSPSHPLWVEGQHPLMTWSRNARLFPGESERGAYLPVMDLLRGWVLEWGYRGWLSMEVFDPEMFNKGDNVPVLLAERGQRAWGRCLEELLDDGTEDMAVLQRSVELRGGKVDHHVSAGGRMRVVTEEVDNGDSEGDADSLRSLEKFSSSIFFGGLDGAVDGCTLDSALLGHSTFGFGEGPGPLLGLGRGFGHVYGGHGRRRASAPAKTGHGAFVAAILAAAH